jgi:tetratricopeptide (TPR) repeat protein
MENMTVSIYVNMLDVAKEYFKNGNSQHALAICHEIITFEREQLGIYELMAEIYFSMNKYAEATIYYDEAIKMNSMNPIYYYLRGKCKCEEHEYDAAMKDFLEATRIQNDFAEPYHEMGRIQHCEGLVDNTMLEKALTNYSSAIRFGKIHGNDKPEYYFNRALVNYSLSHFLDALNDVNTAINMNYKLDRAYDWQARIYEEKNDYRQAIKSYTRAILHTCAEDLDELCPLLADRGKAYTKMHNYRAAIRDFNAILRLDPHSRGYAYEGRGNAYLIFGYFRKAIKDYTTAINIGSEFSELYTNRAAAYLSLGNYSDAIEDLDHAMSLEPSDQTILTRPNIKDYVDLYNHVRKVYFPRWDRNGEYNLVVDIRHGYRHISNEDEDKMAIFQDAWNIVMAENESENKAYRLKVIELIVEYENDDELFFYLIKLICKIIYGTNTDSKKYQTAMLNKANMAVKEGKLQLAKKIASHIDLNNKTSKSRKELGKIFKSMKYPNK